MAANYQGYRFWSNFTGGENAYFKCSPGVGWVRNRNFTWTEYVSDAWDEAINCSEFRKPIAKKVEAALISSGLKCPLLPEKCDEISRSDHAAFFTSPKCLSTVAKY